MHLAAIAQGDQQELRVVLHYIGIHQSQKIFGYFPGIHPVRVRRWVVYLIFKSALILLLDIFSMLPLIDVL
jgi:hypothetical protein